MTTIATNGRLSLAETAPPHDDALEAGVLEGLFKQPEQFAEVEKILRPDDFFSDANRIIYQHIAAVCRDGGTPDMTRVVDSLKQSPADTAQIAAHHDCGWMAYVALLYQGASPGNATYYAERVRELANRRRLRELGIRLQQAAHGRHDVGQEIVNARTALEDLGATQSADKQRFELLTCAALAGTQFALEYLISWLVVMGQPLLIAGPKKALKTSLVVDLALSLATGLDFLGRFRVNRRAGVLVMTGESGMATIQETALRVADAKGISLAEVDDLHWCEQVPRFDDAEDLDWLRRRLEETGATVVVVDPAYMTMSGADAGNLFVQGSTLKRVNDLCQEMGAMLVLVHHLKKGVADPYEPPELESIAWAGFQEWARQWLLLGRREPYEPGSGEHRLWLSSGGSAGHSSLHALNISEGAYDGHTPRHWSVEVLSAAEARAEAAERVEGAKDESKAERLAVKVQRARDAFVKALGKFPAGETLKVLRETAGLDGSAATRQAFGELVQEGTVIQCNIEKPNRRTPYEGYRLAD